MLKSPFIFYQLYILQIYGETCSTQIIFNSDVNAHCKLRYFHYLLSVNLKTNLRLQLVNVILIQKKNCLYTFHDIHFWYIGTLLVLK